MKKTTIQLREGSRYTVACLGDAYGWVEYNRGVQVAKGMFTEAEFIATDGTLFCVAEHGWLGDSDSFEIAPRGGLHDFANATFSIAAVAAADPAAPEA